MSRLTVVLPVILLLACGGGATNLPDESEDIALTGPRGNVTPAGPELSGSVWRWVSAACTEGPLDLSSRGFSQTVALRVDGQSMLLTYDQTFRTENCVQTIVQRAIPGPTEWQMIEESRVSVPPTPACERVPERPRPGAVVTRGADLEVYVQRSNWCNGYEVKMVYQRVQTVPQLTDDQIIRHYVAHFNRKDPASIAGLFAETGSLLDPFLITDTGDPYRHEGRANVQTWFEQAFGGIPWVALRMTGIERGANQGQWNVSWQYMDPRLQSPLEGRYKFTMAAGEIFEEQLEGANPYAPSSSSAGAQAATR